MESGPAECQIEGGGVGSEGGREGGGWGCGGGVGCLTQQGNEMGGEKRDIRQVWKE